MASIGRNAWVKKVLGADLPVELDVKRIQAAIAAYHDSVADVGNGVASLQAKMRASGDPLMKQIADEGLKDVTGGFRVTMSAALMELVQAPPKQRPQKAKVVHKLCGKIAGFVDSNPLFRMLDANPLGVQVKAQATLQQALKTLDQEVAASVI